MDWKTVARKAKKKKKMGTGDLPTIWATLNGP